MDTQDIMLILQEMSAPKKIILSAAYLLFVNILAFWWYGSDKQRAREGRWRISEKSLLWIAIVGGSIGAIAGMRIFRHKTKHPQFRYGLPIILIMQLALSCYTYKMLM